MLRSKYSFIDSLADFSTYTAPKTEPKKDATNSKQASDISQGAAAPPTTASKPTPAPDVSGISTICIRKFTSPDTSLLHKIKIIAHPLHYINSHQQLKTVDSYDLLNLAHHVFV